LDDGSFFLAVFNLDHHLVVELRPRR